MCPGNLLEICLAGFVEPCYLSIYTCLLLQLAWFFHFFVSVCFPKQSSRDLMLPDCISSLTLNAVLELNYVQCPCTSSVIASSESYSFIHSFIVHCYIAIMIGPTHIIWCPKITLPAFVSAVSCSRGTWHHVIHVPWEHGLNYVTPCICIYFLVRPQY